MVSMPRACRAGRLVSDLAQGRKIRGGCFAGREKKKDVEDKKRLTVYSERT
jgi:hypothetical protein